MYHKMKHHISDVTEGFINILFETIMTCNVDDNLFISINSK